MIWKVCQLPVWHESCKVYNQSIKRHTGMYIEPCTGKSIWRRWVRETRPSVQSFTHCKQHWEFHLRFKVLRSSADVEICDSAFQTEGALRAKLHYTDTGYGHVVQHHQRTSSQQFYNFLYNKFTTNGQKFATFPHLDMSRCWAVALWCGKFVVQQVVELLWAACPLVVLYSMSVAGVRVVEFGTNAVCVLCT